MLFLIPARAGSKRFPFKNVTKFCGLPLYMWSLMTAQRLAGPGDSIVLSTDFKNVDLCHIGQKHNRPPHLCKDETTTQELIDHAFNGAFKILDDTIVLLQPTSPTRSDTLVRKLIEHGGQVRSVTDGIPNGQCYVYRKGHTGWIDIETEKGFDIDYESDFNEAEKYMMEKFK